MTANVLNIQGQKLEELSLLFSIAQILDQSLDIKLVIDPVLEAVAENFQMLRGTISLLDSKSSDIFIESAYGLSRKEMEKGQYKLGEGITGQVVKTGVPKIIPNIAENPDFLNRTAPVTRVPKKNMPFFVCR